MALSESDSTASASGTLPQLLDASDRLATLSNSELKAVYVRVRLAREAMGEFAHDEIVEWLADPCDDYLGQFAQKLGLEVSPWNGDVVTDLWNLCLADDVAAETAHETVRDSLCERAQNCVGTPDAIVLKRLLAHYTAE